VDLGYFLSTEDGLSLPTKATEEFRPFMRQLPEFKFWSVHLFVLQLIPSPSVLWHCWLGNTKGNWLVKSWVLVCWWWRFDRSFARLFIAPVAATSSTSLLAPAKSRMETFWYRLNQVCLQKWPLKQTERFTTVYKTWG